MTTWGRAGTRTRCTDGRGRQLHPLPQGRTGYARRSGAGPGYRRDKRELFASEIRDLKADPCGKACYLAPIREYFHTLYPYNLFRGDVRPRDVPGFCRTCRLTRAVTEAEVIREPEWWKGAVELDNMNSMCGGGCYMRPLPELVRRVFQAQRRAP